MKKQHNKRLATNLYCPVEAVSGVWRFDRPGGHHATAQSTPGHLLHCHIKGTTTLQANGRNYEITPNSVIYYHESEEVKNHFIDDVIFYSIAFNAPKLSPLPLSRRVFKVENNIVELFHELYEIYTSNPPDVAMRLYALLLSLLPQIGFSEHDNRKYHSTREKLWLEVESWVRKNRKFRAGIPELSAQFKISAATLLRACRKTAATSVSKRLQQMRMEEARALLLYSGLNITETAEYLGYPRIHEFSREFSSYHKHPASHLTINQQILSK
jgi:AraC-like DNA-binding protein